MLALILNVSTQLAELASIVSLVARGCGFKSPLMHYFFTPFYSITRGSAFVLGSLDIDPLLSRKHVGSLLVSALLCNTSFQGSNPS